MILFSKHALDRMAERNFTQSEIIRIIENDVSIVDIPSKSEKHVVLICGVVNHKKITVIMNEITGNVITVRAMRKNEYKQFKEKENKRYE